jgi:hypothetical protein
MLNRRFSKLAHTFKNLKAAGITYSKMHCLIVIYLNINCPRCGILSSVSNESEFIFECKKVNVAVYYLCILL